jgi:lauroyl/myristoyl acyltransferase
MMEFLDSRLTVENRKCLDTIAAAGTGGIIVTGHFGAVEFLPLAMAMKGYRVAMIVRFKTKALKRELMKRAALTDVILIDADEPKVAFRALEVIKSGRFLITECDEFSEWRPHKSQMVSVFGNRVSRDKTLDFFYRRAKVPAVLCLMKRTQNGFVLSVDNLADGTQGVSVAERAWQCLENHILEAPEQWYQWKDAASVLEGFMTTGRKDRNAHKEFPGVPDSDPVLAAG